MMECMYTKAEYVQCDVLYKCTSFYFLTHWSSKPKSISNQEGQKLSVCEHIPGRVHSTTAYIQSSTKHHHLPPTNIDISPTTTHHHPPPPTKHQYLECVKIVMCVEMWRLVMLGGVPIWTPPPAPPPPPKHTLIINNKIFCSKLI